MTEHPLDLDELLSQDDFVRSVCRSLLGSGAEADDSAQDAWVKALGSSVGPRRGPPGMGWLRTVAKSAVISRYRSDRARQRRERDAVSPRATVPTPDEILLREDLRRRVVESVLALDERYRTPVVLHHFEERTAEQIAVQLDVPLQTVWTRLHRARIILRVALKADDPGRKQGLCVLAGIPVVSRTSISTGVLMGKIISFALVGLLLIAAGFLVFRASPEESVTTPGRQAADARALLNEPKDLEQGAVAGGVPAVSRNEASTVPATEVGNTGALLTGRVIDISGAAVPGARIREIRSGAEVTPERTTETDSVGRFVFSSGLLGATLRVGADGLVAKDVRVWPGDDPLIVLHQGIEVRGRVLDATTGSPIEGAVVNAKPQYATSDESGHFSIVVPSVTRWFGVKHGDDYVRWRASPFFAERNRELVIRLPRVEAGESRYMRIVDGRDGAAVSNVAASPGPCELVGDRLWRVGMRRYPAHSVGNVRAPGYLMTVVEATDERGRTPSDPIEVRLVPPVTVQGVVVDADSRPIAGATVRSRRGIVGPIWGHSRVADEWEWICETDSAGRFSFTGPPPFCSVYLAAGHPAYPEVQESVQTDLEGAEARIELQAGNTLVGRVERSSDGSPVEGAAVQVDENHVAITEGDGRFRLDGLPDQVHLKVRAPGLVEVEVFNIPVAEGEDQIVRISAGASISGRVVDSTGIPVPFANVRGFSSMLDEVYPEGTRASTRPRCEAGPEGRFTLSAMPEGYWYLSAAPHDSEPSDRWYLGKRVHTGESDITLTARGLTGVAFRVIDRETGEPLSPIRCFGPTGSESGPNANASTFLTVRPDTPGTIGVSAAGYVPEIRNGVVVAPGEIREEVFHLARASDLHGRLVDERSQAIPRATLVLRPEGLTDQDAVDVTTVTDSEGSFIARGVVPGNWHIVSCSVFGVDGAEERLLGVTPPDLSLEPSDTEATLVAVPPGGRAVVRGYVTLWENTLRAAVIVHPHGIRVPVDERGYFVAEGVPAGPAAIALECDRGDHGTITRGIGEVEVPEVGTLDVDLRKAQ